MWRWETLFESGYSALGVYFSSYVLAILSGTVMFSHRTKHRILNGYGPVLSENDWLEESTQPQSPFATSKCRAWERVLKPPVPLKD